MLVGVDPGGTTGLVMWRPGSSALEWFAQYTPQEAVANIWSLIDRQEFPVHVACERFDITPKTGKMSRQYDALYVTGALKLKIEVHNTAHGTEHVFKQYARSDAKTFANNERLKKLGWYTSGREHTNDACRQLIMHIGEVYPEILQLMLTR